MNIDEEQALAIAKQIKLCSSNTETFWESQSKITLEDVENDFYGYGDYEDQLSMKNNLLKVVRKCIIDNFPILEYSVFDVEGGITLVNTTDYQKGKDIKTICFFCLKNEPLAIPVSIDGNKLYKNCFHALDK